MAGAPEKNKNAETWPLKRAKDLFEKCLQYVKDQENKDIDFIGEVALACDTYLTQLEYLKDKFPELKITYSQIKSCCEANCFRNGKNSKIVPSLAIMNLKSNHGWTDRVDQTTKDKELPSPTYDLSNLSDAALRELANASGDNK